MEKRSSEGLPCTYCDLDAIPGTNPPCCELHKDLVKEASETKKSAPSTLKELDV
jgi:hypothetical protein